MSRNEKMEFIRLIKGSYLSISAALAKYNIPRSTFNRLIGIHVCPNWRSSGDLVIATN